MRPSLKTITCGYHTLIHDDHEWLLCIMIFENDRIQSSHLVTMCDDHIPWYSMIITQHNSRNFCFVWESHMMHIHTDSQLSHMASIHDDDQKCPCAPASFSTWGVCLQLHPPGPWPGGQRNVAATPLSALGACGQPCAQRCNRKGFIPQCFSHMGVPYYLMTFKSIRTKVGRRWIQDSGSCIPDHRFRFLDTGSRTLNPVF